MTVVDLAVVGLGLVSPSGLRPVDHAFFVRAGQTLTSPRVFLRSDGERVDASHCTWLGGRVPLQTRVAALAKRAIESALAPVRDLSWLTEPRVATLLVGPTPWPAYSESAAQDTATTLGRVLPLRFGEPLRGAAGIFQGLATAHQWIQGGEPAVLLVAADSSIGVDALAARAAEPRRWDSPQAPLAEAAAAFLVTDPARAASTGLQVLGTIHFAGVALGLGADDDDEIVDGSAMTQLLGAAAGFGPFACAFGQHNVDSLRRREFDYAVNRNARVIAADAHLISVEDDIGRVGAAAGGVHLAYALATRNHRTVRGEAGDAFVAWAISRDGYRGLCVGRGAGHD